jgi:hypothetical protein
VALGPIAKLLGGITYSLGGIIKLGGAAARSLGKVAAVQAGTAAASTAATAAATTSRFGATYVQGPGGLYLPRGAAGTQPAAPAVPPAASTGLAGLGAPVAGAVVVTAAGVAAQKKLLDELGVSLTELGVIGQGIELLPGLGHMLRQVRLLQELDEAKDASGELATAHEMVAVGLFDTTRAAEAYRNVSEGAIQATRKQRAQLAGLVGALDSVGQPLDSNTQAMVNNLLRMGDWRAAIRLLQGELDDTVPKALRHSDSIDHAAESAADHTQKIRGMSAALRGVPPRVSSNIEVIGIQRGLGLIRAWARSLDAIPDSLTTTVNVRTIGGGDYRNQVQHSGGIAGGGAVRYGDGLRSDEYSTILQRGEIVLSKATARSAPSSPGRDPGGGDVNVTNNYIGSFVAGGRAGVDELASHMEPAIRERSILLKKRPGSRR